MLFLKKVWGWLKKWWKLVVGFLLALGGIGVGIAVASRDTSPSTPIPPDLGDEANDALDAVEEANRKKQEQLEQLEQENAARLQGLSEDQQCEYERVKEQPIDEVAKWIDNI